MAGRNCADIVFCIDASGSMAPCLEAVREHVGKLLESLNSDAQVKWDVRFDFLTFQETTDGSHLYRTVRNDAVEMLEAIYQKPNPERFFTRDLEEFRRRLFLSMPMGEEMQLVALDVAMDFPWRSSNEAHRVVVLLTDEPVETGLQVRMQTDRIEKLIEKLMKKRIKLFIVAPESDAFYRLSAADRCEYTDLESENDGLRGVDFSKMLSTIGKSVSVSQSYEGGSTEPMPLFHQNMWSGGTGGSFGADR